MHHLSSAVLGLLALTIASAGGQSSRVTASSMVAAPLTDSTVAEINETLREQSAIIDLTDGRTVRGYDVEVAPDSTYWTDLYTHPETQRSVATGEVQRIAVYEARSHWVGRLLGGAAVATLLMARSNFLTGYLVGTGVKILVGAMVGELMSRRLARDTRAVYQAPAAVHDP